MCPTFELLGGAGGPVAMLLLCLSTGVVKWRVESSVEDSVEADVLLRHEMMV